MDNDLSKYPMVPPFDSRQAEELEALRTCHLSEELEALRTCHLSEACLDCLPVGKFIKFDTVRAMDDQLHNAVVWSFYMDGVNRLAYFDIITGEYLGDVSLRR